MTPNVTYTGADRITLLHVPDPWDACFAWERIYPPKPSPEMCARFEELMGRKKLGENFSPKSPKARRKRK